MESFRKIKGCNPFVIEEHQLPSIFGQQLSKGSYMCITDKEDLLPGNDQIFKLFLRVVDKGECYFETSLFKKKGTCTNEFITDVIIDILRQNQPSIAYSIENKPTIYISKGSNTQSSNIPLFKFNSDKNNIVQTSVTGNDTIKIIPLTNWCNPVQFIEQLSKFKPPRTKIEFTLQQPDYALVVNSTNIETNPMKTLYYMMEPNGETLFDSYLTKHKKQDGIGMNFAFYGSHQHHLQLQEYWISKTVSELQHTQISKDDHLNNVLSVCVSDRYVDPGHIYRIQLLRECERLESEGKLGFKLHIYGTCKSLGFRNYKGPLPEKDKTNGLFKYKYHFNAENHCIDNYITEKFNDALMSECYLFYYGASNANKYFNDCFTMLTGDIQKDIQTIQQQIQSGIYETKKAQIKCAKQNAILEQNIYHRLESTITLSSKTICLRITHGTIPEKIDIQLYQSKGWSLLAHNTVVCGNTLEYLTHVFQLAVQHDMNMVCTWEDDNELYQTLLFKYARSLSENTQPDIISPYPQKSDISLFRQSFFIRRNAIDIILTRIAQNKNITEKDCLEGLFIF